MRLRNPSGRLDRLVVVADVGRWLAVCAPPQWTAVSLGVRQQKKLEGNAPNERPRRRVIAAASGIASTSATHVRSYGLDLPTIIEACDHSDSAPPVGQDLHRAKVFSGRAARYGDKAFLKFGDETIKLQPANETVQPVRRPAGRRGVGHRRMSSASCCATHRSSVLLMAGHRQVRRGRGHAQTTTSAATC